MVRRNERQGAGPGYARGSSSSTEVADIANVVDERTALLPSEGEPDQTRAEFDLLRVQIRPRVTLVCLVFIFMIELGAGMGTPPTNQIMERIICRQIHPELALGNNTAWGQGGPDDPCKSEDVQSYLALLRGWSFTFEAIPGILCSVPYGILSDRWGRKPVLFLATLGVTLAHGFNIIVFLLSDIIPLWVTWLGAIFLFIGGTGQMVVAMMYTILADIIPAAERADAFFRITAIYLVSAMIAGPLAGAIMVKSDWVALILSLAVLLLCFPVGMVLPETLGLHGPRRRRLRVPRETADGSDADDEDEEDTVPDGKSPALQQLWRNAQESLGEVRGFVFGNKRLVFLMMSVIFVILGKFVQEMLMQYATKRYGWSWSKATLLLTIRSAATLATLLALLPFASWFCMTRLGMSGITKDIWLARISGLLSIVGALVIAAAVNGYILSVGLVWLSLGGGISQLTRSLLNSLVEEHHLGVVNSLVAFMEMTGLMMAGPVLAKSLSIGMQWGGPWIGLPFLIAAGFLAIATAILFVFRPSPGRRGPQQ